MDKLPYVVLAQTPASGGIKKEVVLSKDIKTDIINRTVIVGLGVASFLPRSWPLAYSSLT